MVSVLGVFPPLLLILAPSFEVQVHGASVLYAEPYYIDSDDYSGEKCEELKPRYATAVLNVPRPDPCRNHPPHAPRRVTGILRLQQLAPEDPVLIQGAVFRLKPLSKHALHIHEFGVTGNNCSTAGRHFNPENVTHGGLDAPVSHPGDLGNVVADAQGTAVVRITTAKISLHPDDLREVNGRSFVLHNGEDDLGLGGQPDSLTTGNSGGRLVCGTIAVSGPPPNS